MYHDQTLRTIKYLSKLLDVLTFTKKELCSIQLIALDYLCKFNALSHQNTCFELVWYLIVKYQGSRHLRVSNVLLSKQFSEDRARFYYQVYIQGMSDAANRLSWTIYLAVPTQPPKGKKDRWKSRVPCAISEKRAMIFIFIFIVKKNK